MRPVHGSSAGYTVPEGLTRQLIGLPFPLTTPDLREVGARLLLPAWVLSELDALPLQMSFSGPAEVSRYLSRRVGHAKPTQSTGTAGQVCSRRQVGRRSTRGAWEREHQP